MPMKLNIGLTKKVGLPDYGSLGASCHVEVELDSSLIQQDLDSFHRHVRNAYVACSQAVNDELHRHRSADGDHAGNGQRGHHNGGSQNGSSQNGGAANGNGTARNARRSSNGRKATQSQVRAIWAIADRQNVELVDLLRSRYGTDRPEDLSIGDASTLIDELKGATNGNGASR